MPSFKDNSYVFLSLPQDENVCVFKAVKKNRINPKWFHNARKVEVSKVEIDGCHIPSAITCGCIFNLTICLYL